ncbi:MAG: S9 family peptidase [Flavobacteriales bacterium]|nr:MAG: S9 family peptidase [Flavobacteriales bacterium]
MKYTNIGIIVTIMMSLSCSKMKNESSIQEPRAKKIPRVLEIHNDQRIDHYYWLRERENPEVIAYLEKENSYREAVMKGTEELQDELFKEIRGRIKEDDESVPYRLDGYWYYTRYEKDQEYPIYCRKIDQENAPEEILFNVNEMAKGFDYYQLGGISISPDNQKAAFAVDTVSRRIYSIYVKDLSTGEIFSDVISGTTGNCVWANDNKTLFYSVRDPQTLRADRIFRHRIGESKDTQVYFEEDETFVCSIGKTRDRSHLMIHSSSTMTDEYRILDASTPNGEFKIFSPRKRGLEYNTTRFNNQWYIITNADGATNFKLMTCSDNATDHQEWKEFIGHREDVFLEDIELFDDYFVLEEKFNGLTRLQIRNWKNPSTGKSIEMDDPTYSLYLGSNPEPGTNDVRFGYSSMNQPGSVRSFNVKNGETTILKETEVVGGFDKTQFVSERIWATATDGTKIPISLVRHINTPIDGTAPTILYGYGSYGYSLDAGFSIGRLSLLERGFIYAIAHIRGGSEMGRQWYEDGKLLKKRNTFTDFIACAEHLINLKYTQPEKLFAWGGSAGGLLVGAVANMRPELFRGIVAEVPFVDVVTTMLDETIPLTTGEYDEWGNPNEKEYYFYMKSYSPYDNVKAQDYPAMLITTGLHDSQVQYWEPAKWIALLREKRTNNLPLLMHCEMTTGHGGASGRFTALKEVAMKYAFVIDLAQPQ